MKKIYFISAIALLIFTTISCEKDELPEATQIGANTLGCKINGKPFKCIGKEIYAHPISTPGIKIYRYSDSTLIIDANPNFGWNDYSFQDHVYFTFKYDGGLGKYTDIKDVVKGTNSYIKITKINEYIISGQFEITKTITLNDENDKKYEKVVKYTDGRFDIEFKEYRYETNM